MRGVSRGAAVAVVVTASFCVSTPAWAGTRQQTDRGGYVTSGAPHTARVTLTVPAVLCAPGESSRREAGLFGTMLDSTASVRVFDIGIVLRCDHGVAGAEARTRLGKDAYSFPVASGDEIIMQALTRGLDITDVTSGTGEGLVPFPASTFNGPITFGGRASLATNTITVRFVRPGVDRAPLSESNPKGRTGTVGGAEVVRPGAFPPAAKSFDLELT